MFVIQLVNSGDNAAIPVAVRGRAWTAYEHVSVLAERLAKLVKGRVFPCLGPFPEGESTPGAKQRWEKENCCKNGRKMAYIESHKGSTLFSYWVFHVYGEDTDDGTKEEDNDT